MPPERESRPVVRRAANDLANGELSPSKLDDVARHIDGTFVLVVKVTAGRYRRRCFLTAQSAENAVRRATNRGETATVHFAELKPLFKVRGEVQ